jgi:hypothetical protein
MMLATIDRGDLSGSAGFVLAALLLVFSIDTASAVEFSVLNAGGNSVVLRPGETVEIEIAVDNLSETAVNAIAASIFGYDESIADFIPGTGRSADSFFVEICVGPNVCGGGIGAALTPTFPDRLDLVESEILGRGKRVQFMHHFTSIGDFTNETGALDQGWDGTQESPDSIVAFQAVGLGTTVIEIGTGYEGDTVVLPGGGYQPAEQSATFTIQVIPEPTIAVLMALGLAGLAGLRGGA